MKDLIEIATGETDGMHVVPGARLLGAAALFVVLWTEPAPASPRIPTEVAWGHLQDMERLGILRDPYWAHAFWAQSLSAPGDSARVQDLRWALRFDRDLDAARWALCRAYLSIGDPEAANQFVLLGEQALRSFLTQQRAAVWLLTVGGGALIVALTLMALVSIARTVPLIHHGAVERLIYLPREIRRGAAWLTVLAPVLVALTLPPTAAVLWLLLLGTVGAWPFLERGQRKSCVTAGVLVLLAPLVLAGWTRLAEISQPDSYLRALWTAQTGNADLSRQSAPRGAENDPAHHASLALINRRAGRYDEAIAGLERAVRLAPDEWSYYNNLGNVQLLAGDPEAALVSYARARVLSPDAPLVRVNEAQAWMRKLRFTRAEEALDDAARLGYELPPSLHAGHSDVAVGDRVLDAGGMWARFVRGHPHGDELTWQRAGAMVLAPLLPLRPAWLVGGLLLAIAFVSRSSTLPRAHRCAGCGAPICRKCHYRVLRRSLCSSCNAIRLDTHAPLKREALLRERRTRTLRWSRLTGVVASAILPGTGQLLAGIPRRARIVAFLAVALLAAHAVQGFGPVPDPGFPGSGAGAWGMRLSLAIYALLAVGSVRAYLRFSSRSADPSPAREGAA